MSGEFSRDQGNIQRPQQQGEQQDFRLMVDQTAHALQRVSGSGRWRGDSREF